MFQKARHISFCVALIVSILASSVAAAGSVSGFCRTEGGGFGYWYETRTTVDAEVINGVSEGTVVQWIMVHNVQLNRRYQLRLVYDVLSLTIVGNEAWVVAFDAQNGQYWNGHIVDVGNRGDLLNGFEIRGDFDVIE